MSKSTSKTRQLTQLSLLIALEAVMAFTPLGFIMIPPISITILHIPVIIGAILMGPTYGGILGGAFGVLSMIKATFFAASPADLLFSPFASGAPVQSAVMCIVPRILLGVVAALLYQLLRQVTKDMAAMAVSCILATLLHSVMVLGAMWLFFQAMPLRDVFVTVASLNCIVEMLAAGVVGTAVCKPVMAYLRKGA
jgi:uncharacterized membrane protein